jgi:hypothetical protein
VPDVVAGGRLLLRGVLNWAGVAIPLWALAGYAAVTGVLIVLPATVGRGGG